MNHYEAEALCLNCGYKGPVRPEVGQHISKALCPVCQTQNLSPQAWQDWKNAQTERNRS